VRVTLIREAGSITWHVYPTARIPNKTNAVVMCGTTVSNWVSRQPIGQSDGVDPRMIWELEDPVSFRAWFWSITLCIDCLAALVDFARHAMPEIEEGSEAHAPHGGGA
jgi:hypothetical protein